VSSAPAPQFDPGQLAQAPAVPEPAIAAKAEPNVERLDAAPPAEPSVQVEYVGVIHLTRTWVQYGILGFAVLCIVIGAVEALFGR
jgi:hypothetical protein